MHLILLCVQNPSCRVMAIRVDGDHGETVNNAFGRFRRRPKTAMPMGLPLVHVVLVWMAFSLRRSGSKMASTGMMQCLALFQASRKLGLTATISLRAL
jgi:hypothetical protein